MVHRDYREEVGLHSGKKNVPKAVSIIVLLLVAGVIGYSATQIAQASKKLHAKDAAAAGAPATPAD